MKKYTNKELHDLIENDDKYLISDYFRKKDEELRRLLNEDSVVYKLFDTHLSMLFGDNEPIIVDNIENAKIMLNIIVDFNKVFKKENNVFFDDDLIEGCRFKISKSNKLIILKDYVYGDIGTKTALIDMLTPLRLYMLATGYRNQEQAIEHMAEEMGVIIDGKEIKVKTQERIKYQDNMTAIKNLKSYPNLHKILKDNLLILQEIQNYGLNATYKTHKTIVKNGEEMIPFFLTSTYLKENIENIAKQNTEIKTVGDSHIRKVIIMLQNLGLIEQIEKIDDNLKSLLDKSNKYYKSIKFYTVPFYSYELLKKADAKATKLMENNIFVSNVSNKKCKQILNGEQIKDKKEVIDFSTFIIDFT